MSSLHDHLADYLRVRCALGFKLERTEYELRRFVGWLDAREIETITVENALSWATRSPHATGSHPNLLRMIRGFAAYLRAIGVPVEVPASDLRGDADVDRGARGDRHASRRSIGAQPGGLRPSGGCADREGWEVRQVPRAAVAPDVGRGDQRVARAAGPAAARRSDGHGVAAR